MHRFAFGAAIATTTPNYLLLGPQSFLDSSAELRSSAESRASPSPCGAERRLFVAPASPRPRDPEPKRCARPYRAPLPTLLPIPVVVPVAHTAGPALLCAACEEQYHPRGRHVAGAGGVGLCLLALRAALGVELLQCPHA